MTPPDGRSACDRPVHPQPPLLSRPMFVAGRRSRDLGDSSRMRTHAQSRPEIESPRARSPYTAGSEFSPATVLRPAALQFERKRFHAAYANVRGKDDPAKARKGCSTAIARAGMLTVVRRGFACGSGRTGQCALPNSLTTALPSVSQTIYAVGSAGCMAHGRTMHGRQRELNLGVKGTIVTFCAGLAHGPRFRASRRMETD